ncbi:chromatin-remodeling complex subunit Ies6p [[Candida] railenensis]|uniref:Chromatin-remodeling complex subunit Ies6p n=1 Tax=[Candida] railenensis TaxID=45579 RepID=A0A9P0QM10_9ASCO|nr:chromatin-remodeling complex subunit Ies6p [[Candida] railenensis]
MSTTPSNSGFSTSEEIHLLSNITTRPHTFKRPYKTTTRRYKPTKQVISDEVKYLQSKENIKFDTPTYTSVGAPPSLKPRKHYCDITGLPGKYKNPANGLRFYNVEIYQEVIRNMPPGVDQEYLGLRGANVILK